MKKTGHIVVRVTANQLRRLKKKINFEKITISDLIRKMIDDELEIKES